MVRTQVQLTEEQERALRAIARRESISIAEVVRRCIDRALAAQGPKPNDLYARAAGLVGAFWSEATDLAEEHDRHLGQAYE